MFERLMRICILLDFKFLYQGTPQAITIISEIRDGDSESLFICITIIKPFKKVLRYKKSSPGRNRMSIPGLRVQCNDNYATGDHCFDISFLIFMYHFFNYFLFYLLEML
jgi:hypothetical protein